jgi:hypothetical protein
MSRPVVVNNFHNFLAGFGVYGRDKLSEQHWAFHPPGVDQIEAAYRADWIARKIIEIPAHHSTRA